MRFPGTVAGLHSLCYALAIACLASCGASQPCFGIWGHDNSITKWSLQSNIA
jgi:hypothetical protein